MTWNEIGQNHLQAARQLVVDHPRSATSRAYYAARVALAEALVNAGYSLPPRRETPPHQQQVMLIGVHLTKRSVRDVRELRTLMRRLYSRRIDADYKRTVTVDRSVAREAVRDASLVFRLLNLR